MKRSVIVAVAWPASCILSLALGWAGNSLCHRCRAEPRKQIPDDKSGHAASAKFHVLKLREDSELQARTEDDKIVLRSARTDKLGESRSITIYNAKEDPVLDAIQYRDGMVKELTIRVDRRPVWSWGFYADAKPRFKSAFKHEPGSVSVEEVRQYYDRDGSLGRVEQIMHAYVD